MHNVGRAQVRDGEKAGVVDGGPVGIIIALAQAAGAHVRVWSTSAPTGVCRPRS
ncbi:hypothetical protein [Streptomyces sp. HUAS ZL42]|uniref:hypothetical protein n=1 Tax=Streptomyces sp. HUAS ZL42 TaxID=3231715 RepID=UPI00345E6A39